MVLKDTTHLIFGIANDRSYAWHISDAIRQHGGRCVYTSLPGEKNVRRTTRAIEKLGEESPLVIECDASSDEQLDAVFDRVGSEVGSIDGIVHSIAFADREWLAPGKFKETPREAYTSAIDISAYTLAAMARRGEAIMPNGGSIIAMSYYGSEKVVPGYNVMGVAKAALECTARYLAEELGGNGIRVNTISGGPFRTLAASAVGGIGAMLDGYAEKAPLRRNVEGEDVGGAAVFLLSSLSSGITGENLYVDCGANILGT
ncbi:MAG: enoyl-ACP reductase FabI [Planctomycetota bacterium]|jgi:enoyl-[acyl-carrier protein] reductase I